MDDWWNKESLLKFQSPTSILIVGQSNSGKTVYDPRYCIAIVFGKLFMKT